METHGNGSATVEHLDTLQGKSMGQLEYHALRIAQAREANGKAPLVVCMSDLNDQAAKTQALHIVSNAPQEPGKRPHVEAVNCVPPFSTLGAAHDLADCMENVGTFPAGSIFVVTVDPHVGKNGGGKTNILNPRVACEYDDGTILIGPGRDYMRVGEFHGRGKLKKVIELDREKLIKLGLTSRSHGDVFDGLSQFAPAAAAVLHGVPVEHLGRPLTPEAIPELHIQRGTITMIEDGYGNIRLEVDENEFRHGDKIAVRDAAGKILTIASRTDAFHGKEGDVVIPNGSKKMITDGSKNAVYLCAVRENIAETLAQKLGRPLVIGEQLDLDVATPEEIDAFTGAEAIHQICLLAAKKARSVCQEVSERLGSAAATSGWVRTLLKKALEK